MELRRRVSKSLPDQPHAARRRTLSVRTRRVLGIAVLVLLSAIGYGLELARFDVSAEPDEQQFGVAESEARIRLYLQPVAIDAANDTMQVRISVLPPHAGSNAPMTVADRELVLMIYHGGSHTEQIGIHAHQSFPEVTLAFDLESGSIRSYPLDEYTSVVHLACLEAGQDDAAPALPTEITTWGGVLGFTVLGKEMTSPRSGEEVLRFTVRRTGAVAFFGFAVYGAIVVLTLCGLAIGTLVFVGQRRVEVTLVGALGAIVFALPALRNALPGNPPLGIRADVLVFFWAELGAVLALCLFVAAWVRSGARP